MALQLSTTKYETTFATAYHKVENMNVSKNGINFIVVCLHKQNGEALESSSYEMDYDPAGGEPLTQAYTYLKTLPEYAGATDV